MSNGLRVLPAGYTQGRASRAFYRAMTKVCDPADLASLHGNSHQVTVVWDQRTFTSLTGLEIPLRKARGYRFESAEGPVVPTFDLNEVAAGHMNLLPIVIWDFQTALAERGRGQREWPLSDLILWPTPDDLDLFVREARESEFVAWDLETPFSKKMDEEESEVDPSFTILRVSMALPSGKAITFPYSATFVEQFKAFMEESENDKVGWNSEDFDLPRMRHNGIYPAGRQVDAMWLWHFAQPTLPRGLGSVTPFFDRDIPEWKSIGSSQENEQAEIYAAVDSRQTANNYLGIREVLRKRRIA